MKTGWKLFPLSERKDSKKIWIVLWRPRRVSVVFFIWLRIICVSSVVICDTCDDSLQHDSECDTMFIMHNVKMWNIFSLSLLLRRYHRRRYIHHSTNHQLIHVVSIQAEIIHMNFIEIQSWPEIPSIGYFVSLFSQAFNLPEFPDIEVNSKQW